MATVPLRSSCQVSYQRKTNNSSIAESRPSRYKRARLWNTQSRLNETSHIDYRGLGAAPNGRNVLGRIDGSEGCPQRSEAGVAFLWCQVAREEVQQTFQAAAAGAKGSGSRTHLRDSTGVGERWLVHRHAQRQVGRLHRGSHEEVPGQPRTDSHWQARCADTGKTRAWIADRRCRRTNAADRLFRNPDQGRTDTAAPVVFLPVVL